MSSILAMFEVLIKLRGCGSKHDTMFRNIYLNVLKKQPVRLLVENNSCIMLIFLKYISKFWLLLLSSLNIQDVRVNDGYSLCTH